MRQIFYRSLVLSAIALLGVSGCTSDRPTAPSKNNQIQSQQAPLKIAGSSGAADSLKILKSGYETSTPGVQLTLLDSMQSENVITGVKQGLVDLGCISRTLKPEEADSTIEFRAIAQDALLVATHSSVTGVKNLSTDDLKAIYSGSATNWKQFGGPDADIVLLDRPEDESAKRLLRKHYLGDDLSKAPTAVVLRKESELVQMLQSTPNSIGAFSLANAVHNKLGVNRLSLNQIEPTTEHLKSGQYPMARTIGVLWRKNSSAETMASYITSDVAGKVLEQAGFAVTPNVATSIAK
ncbi:MAG: phosphate ABC transporter substrate-binding protein [Alkalinema sp. RU_4_3]|nr:phosphate ABC transporter substrate-binding protein [Alkalinema sp. RU_4_3]